MAVHVGNPQQRMATRAVDEAGWLQFDGYAVSELALRRRILTEARPEVSAAVAGSEAAADEAAALVAAWLASHHPVPLDLIDPALTPLERAGLSVQEDLCLMERSAADGWRLSAGVVCFPSYWRLLEKIGHRQEAIHGPVPHYADDLSSTVSRFFDRLRPGRIISRRNWGFAAHPLLFVPKLDAVDALHAVDKLDASSHPRPQDLWLRSERQTLRALPDTGAILFTIKVQLAPAPALAEHPDVAARLAAAIDAWSPEMLAMRGSRYGGVRSLTTWLRSIAGTGNAGVSRD